MGSKYYITTAIDYVNSAPHIGTAYEKISADVFARFHRLIGDEVFFLMGNDEHSLNVLRAAKAKGVDPQAYTDEMETVFRGIWDKLEIEKKKHRVVAVDIFRRRVTLTDEDGKSNTVTIDDFKKGRITSVGTEDEDLPVLDDYWTKDEDAAVPDEDENGK